MCLPVKHSLGLLELYFILNGFAVKFMWLTVLQFLHIFLCHLDWDCFLSKWPPDEKQEKKMNCLDRLVSWEHVNMILTLGKKD